MNSTITLKHYSPLEAKYDKINPNNIVNVYEDGACSVSTPITWRYKNKIYDEKNEIVFNSDIEVT